MSKIILSWSVLLACIISAGAQNTVSFDNQSGEPALVKLIGLISSEIEVPDGTKQSIQASAGKYFIRVRYGVQGKYHYAKGQEFTVDETAITTSEITITLHKAVNGNYDSSPITEQEFGMAKAKGTNQTSILIATLTGGNSQSLQNDEEKYETVSSSEFKVNMELSGRVNSDEKGLANGGPVDNLSFGGHKVELTKNMIKDGFIYTKDYGKILIKINYNFTFAMELTPTQQKQLKQLMKE